MNLEYYIWKNGTKEALNYEEVSAKVNGRTIQTYYKSYSRNALVMVSLREFMMMVDSSATIEWDETSKRAIVTHSNGKVSYVDDDDAQYAETPNGINDATIVSKTAINPEILTTDDRSDFTLMVDHKTIADIFDLQVAYDQLLKTLTFYSPNVNGK